MQEIALDLLKLAIQEYYNIQPVQQRATVLRTGVGGMDLFEESMENKVGFSRIYIGKKVPRWMRIDKFTILKSRSGRWYRRIGKINLVDTE